MHKHNFRTIFVVILVVLLLWLVFLFPYTKTGMKLTVTVFQNQLEEYARQYLQEENPRNSHKFGYLIMACEPFDALFFDHYYSGFYFTLDGSPSGFQGVEVDFVPQGNGWYWHEATGNNWMYTEHIVGNWYWYEMHF